MRFVAALACLLISGLASAQTVTVSASNTTDLSGNPLNGTIYFKPLEAFRVSGQIVNSQVQATVTNGAFSLTVADTSQAQPINACYAVWAQDNTGKTVLGTPVLGSPAILKGYGCVQVNNSWCSGSTCNFDLYNPSGNPLPIYQVGAQGVAGGLQDPGSNGLLYRSGLNITRTATISDIPTGYLYANLNGAPSALPPNGSAGGDLSGNYPNPTVAAIQGNAFKSGAASLANQVYAWNTTDGKFELTQLGSAAFTSSGTYQQVLGFTPENSANKGQANGYAGLNGSGVVPFAQLPIIPYSQTTGVQASLGFAPENTANKGAASGYAPLNSSSVVPLANLPTIPYSQTSGVQAALGYTAQDAAAADIHNGGTGACASGQYETADNGAAAPTCAQVQYSQISGIPSGLPPSGSAGGDLGGNYPNPTVYGIRGNPVKAGTANTANQAYVWNTTDSEFELTTLGTAAFQASSYFQTALGYTAQNAATADTNNAPLTSGAYVLKGDGSGGFAQAVAGTDFVIPSGNVATATALAAIPAQAPSGEYCTGIAVGGNCNAAQVQASQIGGLGSLATQSATLPTGAIVGTSDTQTLTNKTISGAANVLSNIPNSALTNASLTLNGVTATLGASTNLGQLNDSNGSPVLKTAGTASAVNQVTVDNAVTGGAPALVATGSDTNISLNLVPKGTGAVQVNGTPLGSLATQSATVPSSGTLVDLSTSQILTNKTVDGVTPATMGYVDATSSIQTQLNGKQASLGYTAQNAATADANNAGLGNCSSGQYMTGTSATTTQPCAQVAYTQVSGTPSSLPPSGSAGGDLAGSYPNPTVAKVDGTSVPTNSSADQALITTASATAGWASIPLCLDSVGQHLNYNTTTHSFSCGTTAGTAAAVPFSGITGSTNTSAAMVVGTGASLGPSGTGTVTANALSAVASTALSDSAALVRTNQVNIYSNQAAPGTPSSGNASVWTDSTDKNLKVKNDAGTVSVTVQPAGAVAHEVVTAIASNGAVTQAQLAASDISGLGSMATQSTSSFLADPGANGIVKRTAAGATTAATAGTDFVIPSGSVANLSGGAIGALPYQSGTGATSLLAGNTAATDQVLVSHGTGSAAQAPTLSNAPALSAANMSNFPTLNQNTTGNAATATALASVPTTCSGGQFATGIHANGDAACSSLGIPAFDVNGTGLTSTNTVNIENGTGISVSNPSAGNIQFSLNTPSATTLGGIESISATSHQWIDSISTSGVPHQSQPSASDISGLGTAATENVGTSSGTVAAGNDARFGNATSIQGNAVHTGVPSNGQAYLWNATNSDFELGSVGQTYAAGTGLTLSGNTFLVNYGTTTGTALQGSLLGAASGVPQLNSSSQIPYSYYIVGSAANTLAAGNDSRFGNALQFQGLNISAATPSDGQVYRWSAADSQFELGSAGQTYTNGAGLNLSANSFSVIYGTAANTALQGSLLNAASGVAGLDASSNLLQAAQKVVTASSAPATCSVGGLYFDTTKTAGQNLYACTSTNTWTLEGGNASLPIAGSSLGGVKRGLGITIAPDGTASAVGQPYTENTTPQFVTATEGIAWDGNYWYTSTQASISKLNSSFSNVTTNNSPFGTTSGTDHVGDPDAYNGVLYAPIEHFGSCSDFSNQYIATYSTSTLSFQGATSISAQSQEISSIAVAPDQGSSGYLYVTSYCNSTQIAIYNLSNFAFIGYLTISPGISSIQGSVYRNGILYIQDTYRTLYSVDVSTGQVYTIGAETTGGDAHSSPSTSDEGEGLALYGNVLIAQYGRQPHPNNEGGFFYFYPGYAPSSAGTSSSGNPLYIGSYLELYAGADSTPAIASVRGSSSNNLILNAGGTGTVYLNTDSGTGGVAFGAGTTTATVNAVVNASGNASFGGCGNTSITGCDFAGTTWSGYFANKPINVMQYLALYGGNAASPTTASIRAGVANNLTISAYSTGTLYLNADTGTGGVAFNAGTTTVNAYINSSGDASFGSCGSTVASSCDFAGTTYSGYFNNKPVNVMQYLTFYGGGAGTPTATSIRGSSSGNLVVNGYSTGGIYFNGDTGSGGVGFSNGSSFVQASINSTGNATFGGCNVGSIASCDAAGSTYSAYFENKPVYVAKTLQIKAATFSTLSACSSTLEGSTAAVTDSTTSTYGTTITGGGSSHVRAYCNGTNWVVN